MQEGRGRQEQLARLDALQAPESSLWMRTAPTEPGLRLTDTKWQWAARLRLGMEVPTISTDCTGCKNTNCYTDYSWHSLACLPLSGRA